MKAELKLQIEYHNKHSVIVDSYFTSPLKPAIPDTHEKRLTIVLMMASAGLLKGDQLFFDIICGQGTQTFVTDQSYTKVFDTGDCCAARYQHIRVEKGASFFYRPCATILYRNSSYKATMEVELDKQSEFLYTDIVIAGRIGMGEKFVFCNYHNRISISVDGRPAWIDNCLLKPKTMDVQGMLFFDGYTHQGTFYYYGTETKQDKLEHNLPLIFQQREELTGGEKRLVYGISKAAYGIIVRILGMSAQDIEEVFCALEHTVEV